MVCRVRLEGSLTDPFAGRGPPATFGRHRGEQLGRRNGWLRPGLRYSTVLAATPPRRRGPFCHTALSPANVPQRFFSSRNLCP